MDAINVTVFIIGLISVLGNGTLLIILLLDPLKKFRTSTTLCITFLAFSDFITGIACCCYPFKSVDKIIISAIIWSSIVNSFGTIFIMSLERLIIVVYPFKAKIILTGYRVLFLNLLSLVVSILVGFLYNHYCCRGAAFFRFLLTAYAFILSLVLMLLLLYAIILWKTLHRPSILRDNHQKSGTSKLEKRLMGVLVILVATLILTVVPYVLAALLYASSRLFALDTISFRNLNVFTRYYFPVELLNFAVNPLIYGWRLPAYRNSLLYYFNASRCRKVIDKDTIPFEDVARVVDQSSSTP